MQKICNHTLYMLNILCGWLLHWNIWPTTIKPTKSCQNTFGNTTCFVGVGHISPYYTIMFSALHCTSLPYIMADFTPEYVLVILSYLNFVGASIRQIVCSVEFATILTILPHKVKMQYVHFILHFNYFLLPWTIPQAISRRSMLFNILRQYLPYQTYVRTTFYHESGLIWNCMFYRCLIFAHTAFSLCMAEFFCLSE